MREHSYYTDFFQLLQKRCSAFYLLLLYSLSLWHLCILWLYSVLVKWQAQNTIVK